MRTLFHIALLSLFGVSSAMAASSAKLIAVEGEVLANQGEKYLPVSAGAALVPGDRIMVMQASHAVVEFAGGCTVDVEPGDIVTIPVQSPCDQGQLAASDLAGPLGGELSQDEKVGYSVLGATALGLTIGCVADEWPPWCDGDGRRRDGDVSD